MPQKYPRPSVWYVYADGTAGPHFVEGAVTEVLFPLEGVSFSSRQILAGPRSVVKVDFGTSLKRGRNPEEEIIEHLPSGIRRPHVLWSESFFARDQLLMKRDHSHNAHALVGVADPAQMGLLVGAMLDQVAILHESSAPEFWTNEPHMGHDWWDGDWTQGLHPVLFARNLRNLVDTEFISQDDAIDFANAHLMLGLSSGLLLQGRKNDSRLQPLLREVPIHGDCHPAQFMMSDWAEVSTWLDWTSSRIGPAMLDYFAMANSISWFRPDLSVDAENAVQLRRLYMDDPAITGAVFGLLELVREVQWLQPYAEQVRDGRDQVDEEDFAGNLDQLYMIASGEHPFRRMATDLLRIGGEEIPAEWAAPPCVVGKQLARSEGIAQLMTF